MIKTTYIVLPALHVQRANALATPWLISPIPLFAAVMLGHAIADDLGCTSTGVAYVHHDADLLGDWYDIKNKKSFHPHQYRAASFINKDDYSSKNKHALSLQPTCTAHLTCSLILEVFGPTPLKEDVAISLHGRRLAGGLLAHQGKIEVFDSWEEACRSLKTGFLLRDRHDVLLEKTGTEKLDAFIEHLHERPEEGCTEMAWRSATVVGYTSLTSWKNRLQVREDLTHAFVEPIVGLIDMCSLRQYTEDIHHAPHKWLWNWTWPSDRTLLLQPKASSPHPVTS